MRRMILKNARFFSASPQNNYTNRFWQWTTSVRPPWKNNLTEAAIAFTVFGITGTASVTLVRPAITNILGIEGSLIEGPNSYRIMSVLCISPIYATILMIMGTLAGRHIFFAKMSAKILRRFLPSSSKSIISCPSIPK